jgi:colanic acid biosynthesis glycosyl transferase WcaI
LDILYLSQYFYPEQFLNNHVATALVEAGHRVEVICCVPNYPSGKFFPGYSNRCRREETWNGIRINRVFTVPRGTRAVQLALNYLVYPLAASWKILRLGRRRGEVSFVSMPSPLLQALAGIFAKRVWKIPTVYWVQDIWPESAVITLQLRSPVLVRVLNALCDYIYRQADLVMVQSDGFHRRIMESGVPPERIVTLPNAAPDSFAPVDAAQVPARIRALIPHGRRVVMFAGNIGESQNFDILVEAASKLPDQSDILLVIVGSGRDEARVRAMVEARGLTARFLFLGRHPEADMPMFFACADMMLVSLRDEPIFALTVPSKVQAYLACGKPILAALNGEGAEIVRRAGVGLTVSPSDPAAISRALRAVGELSMGDLTAMGQRARQLYLSDYSLEAVVNKLSAHLQAVVASD